MTDVLLLGAGLVTRPLVRYLLDRGITLTIATLNEEHAWTLIAGHPGGTARYWQAEDRAVLLDMLRQHRLTVSLLPATLHTLVADACIETGRPLVTSSYVSPAMQVMDGRARDAGVLLLNELGVDPGIDHMSAMRVIHDVQARGGKITAFRSYCGGLPAPETNDNPWGYKFSWSPEGVLRAALNGAQYMKNGKTWEIRPEKVFWDTHPMRLSRVGMLEAYPNRDAIPYQTLYGLHDVHTMFRGTLRYPGWSEAMRRVQELGLLDTRERRFAPGQTWAQLMAELIGSPGAGHVRKRVAAALWLSVEHPAVQRLDWLGLFSAEPLPREQGSVLQQLAATMERRMQYREGERDMVAMRHEFVATFDQERQEHITSTMVCFGIDGGDSAMARTVSLPAAIAAHLILEGRFTQTGVHIPVTPEIYGPILDELETLDIGLEEATFMM